MIWMADPVALSLGPITVRWYGLLFSGGFIIGYFMMNYMFKLKGYKTDDLDRLLIYVIVGTVIGARLGHCLIYEPDYYLANPIEILKIWKGGLASHGGTVGVVLAFYLFIKRSKQKYSFFELADMIVVPIALVCTFIRLGNFMNSEILGKPTDGPFGIIFARIGDMTPRYPAQLFEAAAYFATFILLAILYFKWKKRPQGMLLGILLLLIYTARFFIEPLKEEQADYNLNDGMNVGQLLSIPFIIGSLVLMAILYVYDKKKKAKLAANGVGKELAANGASEKLANKASESTTAIAEDKDDAKVSDAKDGEVQGKATAQSAETNDSKVSDRSHDK